MKKQKGIINLTPILLIIIALGAFYFIFRPKTPDYSSRLKETAQLQKEEIITVPRDWPTYVDSNLGVKLKHPPEITPANATIQEIGKEDSININNVLKEIKGTAPPQLISATKLLSLDFSVKCDNCSGYAIYIWKFNNAEELIANKWLEKYSYYPNTISSSNSSLKSTQIAGLQAKTGSPETQYSSIGTFISKDNAMYLIHSTHRTESVTSNKEVNQILSSIKFTE